jgi:hypothetical protein
LACGVTRLGSIPVLAWFLAIVVFAFSVIARRRSAVTFVTGVVVLRRSKELVALARLEALFATAPAKFIFPSGHALLSLCFHAALAGLLTGAVRNLAARAVIWIAAALLILALGLSRIYLLGPLPHGCQRRLSHSRFLDRFFGSWVIRGDRI